MADRPFSLWRPVTGPAEPSTPSDLPEGLADIGWVFDQMGRLGWSTTEVDGMELWQIGRFLGLGDTEPVIRGSRGLTLPSDRPDRTAAGPAGSFVDGNIEARMAEAAAKRADAQSRLES